MILPLETSRLSLSVEALVMKRSKVAVWLFFGSGKQILILVSALIDRIVRAVFDLLDDL